jgi:diapolycopene oxygenase
MTTSSTGQPQRIVIIGGGLAGLAAACTLAGRGYAVTLFDRNDWLGGKAAVLSHHGFRFDMGPTILTMPKVLGRVFAEAGRSMDEELDMVRLDPQWRCFFDGDAVLDLHENVEQMKRTLATFSNRPNAGQRYADFITYARRLHDISDRFFFWKPIGGIGDMFDPSNTFDLKTLRDVMAMRMGRSVASTIRSYTPDPRVAQMLDHFTQYVGSSPYGSPAILCGIAHMQIDEGIWYPIGGTRAVPDALQRIAIDLGVDLRPGEGVGRIETRAGRVTGVITDSGEAVACAAVVSNMDAVRTRRELLDGGQTDGMAQRGDREPACSGVVLYLGLDRRYEHLAHHDFVFSRDPEEEFDWIYRRGEPAPDPTCYLAAPAATEPQVAPEGGEALYVLVHTPYLRPHHDWSKMFPAYRRVILDKLKRTGQMPDIEERIVYESHLTPRDIHDRYRVLNGAIYGLASHGKWTGAFKPSNRVKDVEGLYLAGGAAHPGPGMPMVLMSGWIAADALDRDAIVEKVRQPAGKVQGVASL